MSRRKRYTRNLGRRRIAPTEWDRTTEWIRFEHALDGLGLFTYVPTDDEDDWQDLLDEGEPEHLAELRAWFNRHLGAPTLDDDACERFWFRAEATNAVARARHLADLVRCLGHPIIERHARRVPGKVRWQDADQIAVRSYRDSR